jgi:hypothetical protein
MSDDLYVLIAPILGMTAVGGMLLARIFGTHEAKTARRMRKFARQTIGGFPEGAPGRIVGTIEAHEGRTVTAPLSHRTCVAYALRVEEMQGQGRQRDWETIVEDFDAAPFVVSDGTGRALVRAAGSWPSPKMSVVRTAGVLSAPSPDLVELLDAHGHSAKGLMFNKTLRVFEGVLAVGEKVAVVGIGKREREPADGDRAGYRDAPARLTVESLDDGQLYMSNIPSSMR